MTDVLMTIAILGGTGDEGSGLGLRWADAGYKVIIGSRKAEKGVAAAARINAVLGDDRVTGMDNLSAAQAADIVVVTVPYAAHEPTLESVREAVQGKILVDVTVPLVPPKVARVQLPAGGSAAQEAQALLGENVRVVSAFQNVSAEHLNTLGHPIDCDVLVSGDKKDAREQVITLARAAGMQAWHAGPLANAAVAEALTSVLIGLNKRYKVKNSGIRLTGLPRDDV